MSNEIPFEDWRDVSQLSFEWADCYDEKNFERLARILAPTLKIDYTMVFGKSWRSLPAADFVKMISNPKLLGNPLVQTQHFLGASKYEKISETEIHGTHQIRAAHQKYIEPDKKSVYAKGHGHAIMVHFYKKIDGQWKFAGLRPTVRWNEFEMDKIWNKFDMEQIWPPTDA
ncbi:Scytalone dehydratase [Talaromyces proteolyticus]|uniref:Scytalone dehydratase n=1 Tax=Talaromyces proteolyticus TaxID=1131652 RepID=A0AAD4KY84_9EURO|nr:Scytalone dehydratase [Talaromyces proteolyticus]KAH8698721.1 Scytalone dehydratase [Talaromyces proteolyticus]